MMGNAKGTYKEGSAAVTPLPRWRSFNRSVESIDAERHTTTASSSTATMPGTTGEEGKAVGGSEEHGRNGLPEGYMYRWGVLMAPPKPKSRASAPHSRRRKLKVRGANAVSPRLGAPLTAASLGSGNQHSQWLEALPATNAAVPHTAPLHRNKGAAKDTLKPQRYGTAGIASAIAAATASLVETLQSLDEAAIAANAGDDGSSDVFDPSGDDGSNDLQLHSLRLERQLPLLSSTEFDPGRRRSIGETLLNASAATAAPPPLAGPLASAAAIMRRWLQGALAHHRGYAPELLLQHAMAAAARWDPQGAATPRPREETAEASEDGGSSDSEPQHRHTSRKDSRGSGQQSAAPSSRSHSLAEEEERGKEADEEEGMAAEEPLERFLQSLQHQTSAIHSAFGSENPISPAASPWRPATAMSAPPPLFPPSTAAVPWVQRSRMLTAAAFAAITAWLQQSTAATAAAATANDTAAGDSEAVTAALHCIGRSLYINYDALDVQVAMHGGDATEALQEFPKLFSCGYTALQVLPHFALLLPCFFFVLMQFSIPLFLYTLLPCLPVPINHFLPLCPTFLLSLFRLLARVGAPLVKKSFVCLAVAVNCGGFTAKKLMNCGPR